MDALQTAVTVLTKQEKQLVAELVRVRAAVSALRALIDARAGRTDEESSVSNAEHLAAVALGNVGSSPSAPPRPRPIAWLDAVRTVLLENKRPMHVREIMRALEAKGYAIPDKNRVRDIISGGVTRKARQDSVFTHVGRGTFGLLEWNEDDANETTTRMLLQIVRANPGLTSGEVVDQLQRRLTELPEESRPKRNSRVTRLGQLQREGIINRVGDRLYSAATIPAVPESAPELGLTHVSGVT